MKPVHSTILKNECIKYAANNGMEILSLTNTDFEAEGEEEVIHVPLSHLFEQFQNGWDVQETLENETNHKEE